MVSLPCPPLRTELLNRRLGVFSPWSCSWQGDSGSHRYWCNPSSTPQHPALRLGAEQGRDLWYGGFESASYRWNRLSPNLSKSCLLTFAGRLDCGCVGSTS